MSNEPTILIAGASRGIGHAMAREFASRGWNVIGTVRGNGDTPLHALAAEDGRVRVEQLDVVDPASIAALRDRLEGQPLDALFVNAGIATSDTFGSLDTVSDAEFAQVMATNALGPMRVIAALGNLLPPDGLVGAMSSGLGSIGETDRSMGDCYRASKAALNMLMKNYSVRGDNAARPTVVISPGWIRTDMGGATAPLSLEEAVPMIVDTLVAKRDRPGMEFLDRFGVVVPW